MFTFIEWILILIIILWLDSRIIEFINTLKNMNNSYIEINQKEKRIYEKY